MLWWLLAFAFLLFVVTLRLLHRQGYWTRRGVEQGPSLFRANWGVFMKKFSMTELSQIIYNNCPNARYSGFFQFTLPTLVLRDPDLIKQFTVKDFDHFVNHRVFVPEDIDPLWSKNLFARTNQNWRDMRAKISPTFTSSKMKYLFTLISQNGERFVNHFLKKNEDVVTVEMKDVLTRFANDVIANSAFGIECDSLEDRNNEFYLMGKEASDFSGFWMKLKFFVLIAAPTLCKIFRISLFSSKMSNFFNRIIRANIKSREDHGIVRPDMLSILVKAKNHDLAAAEDSESDKIMITDEDIVAQCLGFFFAGFDSVSTVMSFMSYELGVNPDIQEKLRQEIDETLETCNGKITYEALMNMKYMDMVVSESLRKWPSALFMDRECNKPYTIEPTRPNEKPLHLKEKDIFWLPIFAIQRDPQYFPDPDRFDPERFNDENKANIKPYTYIPFGCGPRMCLGLRFALMEMKILFFHLLTNFEIVPVEKTQIPLKLSKKTFNMTAENGFWFGLKRRNK